jgi:hypothetical protein
MNEKLEAIFIPLISRATVLLTELKTQKKIAH